MRIKYTMTTLVLHALATILILTSSILVFFVDGHHLSGVVLFAVAAVSAYFYVGAIDGRENVEKNERTEEKS